MPTLEIGEILRTTEGTLIQGDASARVTSFTIDSRTVRPGGAFVALRGERTDGHRFVGDAAAAGAALAIVEHEPAAGSPRPPAVLKVGDAAEALARCGALARGTLRGTRFVGLTGSTGKTTTKELIAAGLGASRRVHRTSGNYNNLLGVPLTLLACPDDAEYAVVEMGMNAAGEIATLNRMTRPHLGLVTNVRPVHLEKLRTIDDVAAAKGELFATLPPDATSVVNLDDPHVRLQSMRHDGPRVTFGHDGAADVRCDRVLDRLAPGAALDATVGGERLHLELRLPGAHSASNALAAIAAVHAAGEDLASAARAMEAVEVGPGRGRILRLADDVVLIDDSYNSNPAALAAVLETLRATPSEGRKILIMGDMLELGEHSRAFHQEAGRRAAAAGVDVLIAVGPLARHALESARRSGVPEVHHEGSAASAARDLRERLRSGDLVLVKGSRGVGLDRLVREIAGGGEGEGH